MKGRKGEGRDLKDGNGGSVKGEGGKCRRGRGGGTGTAIGRGELERGRYSWQR